MSACGQDSLSFFLRFRYFVQYIFNADNSLRYVTFILFRSYFSLTSSSTAKSRGFESIRH